MWVLPGWAWRYGATLLCVTGPSTRRKASTALESFKRIGIPILAAVFSLACLVMVGFLSMAPPFSPPSSCHCWARLRLGKRSSGRRAQPGLALPPSC